MPKSTKNTETKKNYRDYGAEFNRVVGDNIRGAVRKLEKAGLKVRRSPHLTAIFIRRPLSMSWQDFKNILRSVLQPRIGGVVLSSSTGRMFVCSNKGNQPGRFVRWV